MAKSQATKSQELAVQEKKELVSKEESTVPARYYVQNTDIYETDDALTVVMEIPGVEKKNVDVNIENDVLRVEGRIDFAKYEGLEPLLQTGNKAGGNPYHSAGDTNVGNGTRISPVAQLATSGKSMARIRSG